MDEGVLEGVEDRSINVDDEDFKIIYEKLEDEKRLDRVIHSDDWKVWHKAWSYIAEEAKSALSNADPDKKTDILRLQLQIQFYENIIPNTIERVKQEAEAAFEAANDRGWINSVIRMLHK